MSAQFGWLFKDDVQDLAAHRTVLVGTVGGVIFNDAGQGFMYKARVDCALINDANQGRANAQGTCVITDSDVDTAFLGWKCTGAMPGCPGDQHLPAGLANATVSAVP